METVKLWDVDGGDVARVVALHVWQVLGLAEVADVLGAGVDVVQLHLGHLLAGQAVAGGAGLEPVLLGLLKEPAGVGLGVRGHLLVEAEHGGVVGGGHVQGWLGQPILRVVFARVQAQRRRADERFLAVVAAVHLLLAGVVPLGSRLGLAMADVVVVALVAAGH